MKRNALLPYKIILALLVFAAIITQLIYGLQRPTFNPFNFFSFFTIESNILGAVILVMSAISKYRNKPIKCLDWLRGATTLYMLMTGIIYVLLLTGIDVQTPLPWVNTVLHYIFPVGLLIDWLIDPPTKEITLKWSLFWLSYPILYVSYSLLRGPLAKDWYPYPFLNVAERGLGQVLLTSLILGILVIPLAILIGNAPKLVRKLSLK